MPTIDADTAGVVWKVLISAGDKVEEGHTVIILESMKMEIPVEAEDSGIVATVHVSEGESVSDGDTLITLA